MPLPPPILPLEIDRQVKEYLRRIHEFTNDTESKLLQTNQKQQEAIKSLVSRINNLENPPKKKHKSESLQSDSPSLLSGGRSTIQSQIPYAPFVTALPKANDPLSRDGAIVILTSTYASSSSTSNGIYVYDNRTNPGAWIKAADVSPAASTNDRAKVLDSDTTVITANANVTTEQNLMSYSIGAGVLNVLAKTLRVTCKGVFTTNAAATSFNIKIRIGGVLVTNLTLATPAAAITSFGWRVYADFVTRAIGGGGALELGFWGLASDTTAGGNCQTRIDAQDAASGAIDLTIANTLQVTCSFGIASASNVCKQRLLLVELLNPAS